MESSLGFTTRDRKSVMLLVGRTLLKKPMYMASVVSPAWTVITGVWAWGGSWFLTAFTRVVISVSALLAL